MKKITSLLMILFSILGFSQDNKEKIQTYLNDNKAKFNLTNQDISDWFVESIGSSESTKIDTYWIKQRYQGIEIYNALSNVWVKNDEVINVINGFLPNINQKVNTTTPTLSALNALQKAFVSVNATDVNSQIIETISNNEFKISNGNLNEEPIKAKLVYQTEKNTLKLAWDLTFYTQDQKHLWNIRIDAVTGNLLEKNDMVISCNFESSRASSKNNFSFYSNFFKETSTNALAQVQGGSYRVVPFNYESPNHHTRDLITNPENATASPKGWHDTNTATGTLATLKYTYTRGNNAWARADYSNTNPTAASTVSTTNGYAPTNAGLVFDYPYGGTSVASNTYIDAACTNLFYMNNICHDIWFQYGFNEPNGNFQQTNYVSGGSPSDYVYADAQDGSTAATPTYDNANFSAPVDGSKGRMQMYLWNPPVPVTYSFLVNSPSTIAGNYDFRQNTFKPGHVDLPIDPAFLQSNIVLYDDGTPDPGYTDNADACNAAVNASALNGKIALVRRSLSVASGGSPCNFTVKVKNAQNAGAIAVIVYNNVEVQDAAGVVYQIPIAMSGADATITIPAIGVTKTIGEMLSNSLQSTAVNVKLQLPATFLPYVNADGDFDNVVIAHEFGHGISIRLAGGRNNSSCLQNAEQMGEGWSDWFALMLDMKPGDVATAPKTVGTFVTGQATTGYGIRNYPYTTDMTVNPETFNYVNLNQVDDGTGTMVTESHNVGEVWATMLWDLTWAYVNKYGYDDNKYSGTGGNNKLMRLVLDAIKLQPCSPTFVQARDAIIAADQATTGGHDYCMIWQVFARRGLGVNANSGLNTSSIDEVEDFTEPAAGPNCTLSTNYFENQELFRVYPNPTNGLLNVRINNYVGKVNIQVIDINGRIVSEYKNEEFNIEKSLNLNNLQTGVYVLKVTGDSLNFTQKIMKE
jgi:extracellular elastinolytic metalloproteinase